MQQVHPLNRARLGKVLALLASPVDGEALAATRTVVRILSESGLRPEDLAGESPEARRWGIGAYQPPNTPPPPPPQPNYAPGSPESYRPWEARPPSIRDLLPSEVRKVFAFLLESDIPEADKEFICAIAERLRTQPHKEMTTGEVPGSIDCGAHNFKYHISRNTNAIRGNTMTALPTFSLRCAPDHIAMLRDLARAFRVRPELVGTVAALVTDETPSSATPDALAGVLARLEAVERWIAVRNTSVLPGEQPAPSLVEPLGSSNTVALQRVADDEPSTAEEGGNGETAADDDFPARMLEARKAHRWTTRQLAAASGVSQATVSHIESHRIRGNQASRDKIAAALKLDCGL